MVAATLINIQTALRMNHGQTRKVWKEMLTSPKEERRNPAVDGRVRQGEGDIGSMFLSGPKSVRQERFAMLTYRPV